MIELKKAKTKIDIKNIKALYKEAFPKFERKPFRKILKLSTQGVCDILCVCDEDNFYGLAITLKHKNLVLLDYFAICPEFRDQGIGSKALKLLQERYNKQALIIEIEDANDNAAENILQRIRRKDFYLKNNMVPQNTKVNIFGCPMEILAFNGKFNFEDYHQIFELYFNKKIASKITLI